MKSAPSKIPAFLAFIIGAMAIFAGGKALLGIDPGYYVINWLLLYNYTIGVLTVSITTFLLWTKNKFALPAAIGTFGLHALVMFLLQTAFRGVVAPDSIRAMVVRLVVWSIILVLMFAQARKHRTVPA